jgi:glycosyltransferase involved in cell wall biosynthesis
VNGRRAFAVVIPAHDAMPFVIDAVASALDQRLPPVEIVVVDDRSTDGTGDAVEARFRSAVAPVRVVRGRFGSAAAARNAGWRAAQASWIAFLDADDVWFPDKLAAADAALRAVPAAGWFFSDGAFRSLDGVLHDSWLEDCAELPEPWAGRPIGELFDVNFILTSSMVVRRDLLETLGGFDETMSHAEDLDLWIRLARTAPGTADRRPLVRYQHRPGGLTRQTEARLEADVALFRRLASDRQLPAALRRRARRRESLAHYKLAFSALREGRGAEARRHLGRALVDPGRAVPVAGVWLATLLGPAWLDRIRRRGWAKRGIAGPTLRHQRVCLEADLGLVGAGAGGRPARPLGAPRTAAQGRPS